MGLGVPNRGQKTLKILYKAKTLYPGAFRGGKFDEISSMYKEVIKPFFKPFIFFFYDKISQAPKGTKRYQKPPKSTKKHQKASKGTKRH